jgi:hypothetical protein
MRLGLLAATYSGSHCLVSAHSGIQARGEGAMTTTLPLLVLAARHKDCWPPDRASPVTCTTSLPYSRNGRGHSANPRSGPSWSFTVAHGVLLALCDGLH